MLRLVALASLLAMTALANIELDELEILNGVVHPVMVGHTASFVDGARRCLATDRADPILLSLCILVVSIAVHGSPPSLRALVAYALGGSQAVIFITACVEFLAADQIL